MTSSRSDTPNCARTAILFAAAIGIAQPRPAYQPASPAIEVFVRDALRDRFVADDIPDQQLLPDPRHVLVREEMPGVERRLTAAALPRIPSVSFELISTAEVRTRAQRTGRDVVFLTVDYPVVEDETASIHLGVDLEMPPKSGLVKMCCCSGRAEFRESGGRWAFVKYARMTCS